MVNGLQQISIDYTLVDEEVKLDALRCVTNVMRDAEVIQLKKERVDLKRKFDELKGEYAQAKEILLDCWPRDWGPQLCGNCRDWFFPGDGDVIFFGSGRAHVRDGTLRCDEVWYCCEDCRDIKETLWEKEFYLDCSLHEYQGEELAAILIQLAWRRYVINKTYCA